MPRNIEEALLFAKLRLPLDGAMEVKKKKRKKEKKKKQNQLGLAGLVANLPSKRTRFWLNFLEFVLPS
ncbi:hypothetical protein V6N13_102067 [Hibiscus sabdariffa]